MHTGKKKLRTFKKEDLQYSFGQSTLYIAIDYQSFETEVQQGAGHDVIGDTKEYLTSFGTIAQVD